MMKIEKRLYPYQRKAIKCFEDAVRQHEMKGAAHPLEWGEIEATYKLAKVKLQKVFLKMNQELREAHE